MKQQGPGSFSSSGAAVLVLLLSGCVTVPDGPSVRVMPAPGKPFEVFANEDLTCRGFAAQSVGTKAQEAANASAVGSAAVGTVVGAAAGALIGGNSRSAGAGAGVGLVAGTAAGTNAAALSAYTLQQRYDYAYEQCMYAKGNLVPGQTLPYMHGLPPPPPQGGPMPPPRL